MLGFIPPRGGSWSHSIRWFFLEHSLVHSDMSKTKIFHGVQQAWSLLQKGLFRRLLEGEVVLNRQPLIWNPLFTDTRQHMLGERTRLEWGRVGQGPARSWAS